MYGLAQAVPQVPSIGVYLAQGMVMIQIGGTITEALIRMRTYADAHNRRMDEVAADIVARRLVSDPDRP